ncbi:MAG: hypothetical protein MMC23_003466 [Stictis urceolatum]|nr:hypothetical protein [Stictis urceolata]
MIFQSLQNSALLLLVTAAASTHAGLIPTRTTKPRGYNASAALKYVINFGDSYSQTGFNINGTKPSGSNILGNPPFPGYTTANGNQQNWLDDLIHDYNKTLTYAYNFASGGATTDASLVAPYAPYPTVLSFINQVQEFSSSLATKPSYAPWTSTNALFSVWMGVNDVGNGWYQSNWSTLVTEILDQYFKQVQILYNAGARKFLFLQTPPIYLTPNIIAQGGSTDQLKAAIKTYNDLVASKAASFKAANSGTTTWVFDTTSSFTGPTSNPSAYGATNATCYSSTGTQCLWFNDYHPGQAIHNQVAKGVAALIGNW